MQATYDPKSVEVDWYERWVDAGLFRPEYRPDGEPFCIVIPPPNVTGSLHMGHALNHVIQDVIIRRKRMQGYATLWLPGSDHAGIATQNVVERDLRQEGMTRYDLGRDEFVEQVWAWKRRYGNRISEQMRLLGDSVDWSRERFTMDEGLSRAVREVFVRLYEEDLIYRGERIINWCPVCATALADIEVEHEVTDGELVHILYPFTEGDGGISVATTRAETMLGDTAVAVHPDDDRYREAVGRTVRLPLLGREIPIVADDAVDPSFGTGAVKVTPAHDPNDFEIAERHGLEAIKVLDEDAQITEAGGPFAGLSRYEAREAVKQALEAEGVLLGVEDYEHSVGHCYRSKTEVEPLLSRQWFVLVRPLTIPAIEAVADGSTRFSPRRWEKNYFHWMENLRDWCISRQIWWGHRIPAWYCGDDHVTVAREEPSSCSECGSEELRQDEDVLDTWFSSALWPFSTLGWPEATQDLSTYYPNSALVTGFDIIFFWVARMMQMGIHFMEEVPYPDVVIHGLIRDAAGRKMSKSEDNVVDPLDVISDHGADPLRLALIQAAAPGHDVTFELDSVVAARKFANKLWNATRFVLSHVESAPAEGGYPESPGPVDSWILSRLAEVVARFDELSEGYRFSDAYGLLYNFAWSEVFDWYLELSKSQLTDPDLAEATGRTLGVVLRDLLKLFHPAIPFVTEELWGELISDGLLAGSTWPEPPTEYESPRSMGEFQELVTGVRRLRAEHGLSPRHPLNSRIRDPESVAESWWEPQLPALAAVDPVFGDVPDDLSGWTKVLAGSVEAFVPVAGLVDLEAERERLERSVATVRDDLAMAETKLAKNEFRERAPSEIVAKEESKANELRSRLEALERQLAQLGS
ncbi:MAG: valine--tRNA ligase [Acidimicrobiia bacterium]